MFTVTITLTVQESVQLFQGLHSESELLEELKTFRVGCPLPGDVLITPAAYLTCEKVCNSNLYGLRSPMHLFHRKTLAAFNMLKQQMDPIFGL